MIRRTLVLAAALLSLGCTALWVLTLASMVSLTPDFGPLSRNAERLQVLDRYGTALNSTYVNRWNIFEQVRLHEIPATLIDAMVLAEDQRFYQHRGQDWLARLQALGQNLLAGRVVRGASTITEQVVRMLHPRPRRFWSRWLEGWEARRLEQVLGKEDIVEFYLNQVPYAARRRGVVQAARYYFDRDLDTLSRHEMLALAVLVRAPSRLDLASGDSQAVRGAIGRLARRMVAEGALQDDEQRALASAEFELRQPSLPIVAGHFLRYVQGEYHGGDARLRTTLDGPLQLQLQALLEQRLNYLDALQVHNAALLVADHRRGEILAWVVAGEGDAGVPDHAIDAVLARRQPGSALKPFLYALAVEKGWTAATVIDDRPLSAAVGSGLHDYHNYSRHFYGPVTVRQALGNSLNIPALKTLHFSGVADYHARLQHLGFRSLARDPDYYGEGLALGNGEVSLLELVQAYAALANRGLFSGLTAVQGSVGVAQVQRVYSPEVASLIGHILSDPDARSLEFGRGSLLNLPVQTAVKTGTSSDYRDSWAVGYDARFVVGVWMGNLDQTPTRGVTGATGPALVLRSAFDRLHRSGQTRPLWLSPRLGRHSICDPAGNKASTDAANCQQRIEYFLPGTGPQNVGSPGGEQVARLEKRPSVLQHSAQDPPVAATAAGSGIRLVRPSPGMRLAMDPRLKASSQALEFVLEGVGDGDIVAWRVDAKTVSNQQGARWLWALQRGGHTVSVEVWRDGQLLERIEQRSFVVN